MFNFDLNTVFKKGMEFILVIIALSVLGTIVGLGGIGIICLTLGFFF